MTAVSPTTQLGTAQLTSPALPLATRTSGLVGSIIDSSTSLLESLGHPVINFAMGSPAPEAIDSADLADVASGLFTRGRTDLYGYAASEGDFALRTLLMDMLHQTDPDDSPDPAGIVITAGGMQGLDIAGKLFIEPDSLVVVESPTYTNGSAVALSYQARLLEIGMDDDGMDVDALEREIDRIGETPRMIYTVPTFQNPSGTTLSVERRRRLIELARRWGSVIVEDDPYGLLGFAGQRVPSIRSLSGRDPLVFTVRTFSKIMAPGLRVGWVDCDPSLRDLIIAAKQALDTCTNFPMQKLVAGYLSEGFMPGHLESLRSQYRSRKEAMCAALSHHLGDVAHWTDPEGGFFIWVTFDDPRVDAEELFRAGLDAGVAFIPGSAFSPTGRFGNSMRLCFASQSLADIEEGVARLGAAYRNLCAEES